MEKTDFNKLFETFVEESAEQLETLENELLKLEANVEDKEAIEEVFRMTHSLKGASSLMGFEAMTALTHSLEDLLQKIRNKEIIITTEIIDILLKSVDMLKAMKDSIRDQKDISKLNPKPLIDQIEMLASKNNVEKPKKHKKKQVQDYLTKFKISRFDKRIIDDAQKSGESVYIIKIEIEEDAVMKSMKSFLIVNNLKGLGQVLRVYPEEYESLPDNKFGNNLLLILITRASKDLVIEQIELVSEIKNVVIQDYEKQQERENNKVENVEVMVSETVKDKFDFRQEKRTTVRVDVKKLDKLMALAGELVIAKEKLIQLSSKIKYKYKNDKDVQNLLATIHHLDFIGDELQEAIMAVRMYTIENIFDRFPRMVRDLAHRSGKEVNFTTEGKETELDKSIIEEIIDPIIHLLRNAVDHGLEPKEERIKKGKSPVGNLTLRARQEENHVIIEVIDDGRGIDLDAVKRKALEKGLVTKEELEKKSESEILEYLFLPGFSTAEVVSEVSGRGIGMDVVKTNIEKLNGFIDISTKKDVGTKVTLKLPLTLAIVQALLVKQGINKFVIPLTSVIETIRLTDKDIEEKIKEVKGKYMFLWRDIMIPVVRLDEFFGISSQGEEKKIFAVILAFSDKRLCLLVEKLIGEQQVVIKSLGDFLGKGKLFGEIEGISGATILGDGSFALVLDIPAILKVIKAHK